MKEQEVFDAASALPSADRAAYLDAACTGQPELRLRIEALLRSHDVTGFMEDGATESRSPDLSNERVQFQPEQSGERIGRYRLLQQIGEGGFGTVWMAEQVEPVTRRVALKIIKAGMDTKEVIARFEAERQALAMMDHPNIAKVHDAGATEKGRPFFVMELVKGIPITKFCDEQKFTTRQRLELFADVCSAINHAHQKGVIHRDIKPSNVMVTLNSDRPVVKVIDFGIAKATQGRLTDKTLFTRFEQFIGTPAYMSPEQTALYGLDIDTRSDIYALGILLYELLTGKPPFDAKTLLSAGYEEMRRIIREVEPPRPSARLNTTVGEERSAVAKARQVDPGKVSRSVAPDLDWIVMKAIEKDRARRYETANGLALDIQRFLCDEPVSAGPPSASYRFRKFARRNRGALRVAAGLAATLLGATAISVWQAVSIASQQRQTQKALESERLTSYLHGVALAQREWDANNVGRAEQILDECPTNLRHWEWHYLKRLFHPERHILLGHANDVSGVAYSKDGHHLATTSWDRLILWNAETGQELLTVPFELGADRKIGPLGKVAFSPNGRRLATAGNRLVKVLDVVRGTELLSIDAHALLVSALAWSPNGRWLASGSGARSRGGGELKIWDAETGALVLEIPKLSYRVLSVAFSPDSKFLAAGTGESSQVAPPMPGELKIWNATTGEELHSLRGHQFWVTSVQFSPSGERIASCSADRTVRVWDVKTSRELLALSGHSRWIRSMAWSPDGNVLATAGDDAVVRLWDAATGYETFTLRGHRQPIAEIAFRPDGKQLASVGGSIGAGPGEAKVWDLTAPPEARIHRGHTAEVTDVAFSPDCRFLVSASISMSSATPGEVISRRLDTGKEEYRLRDRVFGFRAVSFDRNGTHLATGAEWHTLQIRNPTTGQEMMEINDLASKLDDLALSPSGGWLVAVGEGAAVVFDVATGKKRLGFQAHSIQTTGVAVSADGKRFATASCGGNFSLGRGKPSEQAPQEIKIWEAETGREILLIPGGGFGVAFSPNGEQIASGGKDGTIWLWDAATGRELFTLREHTGTIASVVFSPDGKRLASASSDHTIRIWELQAGREVLTLHGHDGPVSAIAFSADGAQLASGGGTLGKPGEVRVWDATPLR